MEQTYRIRVGQAVYTTHDGWSTGRQVPQFSVRANSPEEAARIARDVMLAAADDKGAQAFFGMLDETDDYFNVQHGRIVAVPGAHCGECGEEWPCSVQRNRKMYRPDVSVMHTRKDTPIATAPRA